MNRSIFNAHFYTFQKTADPNTIRVIEEELAYPMTRAEINEGLENLNRQAEQGMKDDSRAGRIRFLVDALKALDGGPSDA